MAVTDVQSVGIDLRSPDAHRAESPYVAFVRWPSEAGRRRQLAAQGIARLLLVEAGHAPPDDWDSVEDWIRVPADPVDLHHRAESLRRTATGCAPVVIDEAGLLRRGDRWVALAPLEQVLAHELAERFGRLVRREALERALWPDRAVEARALDRAVTRLRAKVRAVGLSVRCVPSAGYLLEDLGRRRTEDRR